MTQGYEWRRAGAGRRLTVLVSAACYSGLIGVTPAIGDPVADGLNFRLSVAEIQELDCYDCDGVTLGDISGNGKTDILLSNGRGGETFWYEQGGTATEWLRHSIFQLQERPFEFEGNDLGDFNGDGRLEAVSLDQANGRIYLHAQGSDPRGPWRTAMIRDDRPWLQDSIVADLDGDGRPDLVYTWEGNEPGRGGVNWLKFVGTDVLNPDHWRDYVMVQHESAWWLAPRRLDLNGNGRATDIVFSARAQPVRNPGTKPGVYWLEEPADVTLPWTLHTVDNTLPQPLHVDVGDLSGRGHGRDIVVGGHRDTRHLYWYSFTENWKRYAIPLPEEVNGVRPDRIWNVKTARFKGERDGVIAPIVGSGRGALVFFEYFDGAFRPNVLFPFDYDHPMEDRIILHDIDGDGLEEAFIPDSGRNQNRLLILKFNWRG